MTAPRLVLVGRSGPDIDRGRAIRVWLLATAAHGDPEEQAHAVNALAALAGSCTLTVAAQRWLEGIASGRDFIKREWARTVLLRARRSETTGTA